MIKIYILTLSVLVAIDSFWLGFLAKGFYNKHLGHFFSSKFKLWPAAIFYLVYALALTILVIKPALKANLGLLHIISKAALLGLAAYSAYDMTNLATIKGWPVATSFLDIAWGALLSVLTSSAIYLLIR